MTTMITFNELRQIKDMLPSGSMQKIADELGLDVETVRNYFGGDHYDEGKAVGLHIEQGPNGGIVKLDDTTILEKAKEMIRDTNMTISEIAYAVGYVDTRYFSKLFIKNVGIKPVEYRRFYAK